jgi:hypothetical protein
MNNPNAGPYDSEPTQEVMAAAAARHDGDSVAAANARCVKRSAASPSANMTRESSTGPRERWTRARCGCLPDSSILPVSPEFSRQVTTASPPIRRRSARIPLSQERRAAGRWTGIRRPSVSRRRRTSQTGENPAGCAKCTTLWIWGGVNDSGPACDAFNLVRKSC